MKKKKRHQAELSEWCTASKCFLSLDQYSATNNNRRTRGHNKNKTKKDISIYFWIRIRCSDWAPGSYLNDPLKIMTLVFTQNF